ncbi:MAG: aldehyde dehydrogenase family protein [Beijerinckiaceae bacterium]
MERVIKHYVDGEWSVSPQARVLDVIDPSTEKVFAKVPVAGSSEVDMAVAAARRAFDSSPEMTVDDRIALLERIVAILDKRIDEMAQAISREMGAPLWFARSAQAPAPRAHLATLIDVLKGYAFERARGSTLIRREPIGVCALITPWNWPVNQIMCKVGPAIAAGCTMVLKPSELAPVCASLFAEILAEAGVPKGVFNLLNGDGTTGSALSSHPDVDMVSFTGSTVAGVAVAKAAASTVKRVSQELGGKSPNIILDDAVFEDAISLGTAACFRNTGQSCNAPTRMLVPAGRMREAADISRREAEQFEVGKDGNHARLLGPVVSKRQFDKIQALIQAGIDEGARLVIGGAGRPENIDKGYYVRPTVFADVTPDMTIAQAEIFGPVLSIMGYSDEAEAVRIANDTPYGLAAYVSGSSDRAASIARKLRAGNVYINYPSDDLMAPFGGYKQSGNGREWGVYGLEEFLEIKAVQRRA